MKKKSYWEIITTTNDSDIIYSGFVDMLNINSKNVNDERIKDFLLFYYKQKISENIFGIDKLSEIRKYDSEYPFISFDYNNKTGFTNIKKIKHCDNILGSFKEYLLFKFDFENISVYRYVFDISSYLYGESPTIDKFLNLEKPNIIRFLYNTEKNKFENVTKSFGSVFVLNNDGYYLTSKVFNFDEAEYQVEFDIQKYEIGKYALIDKFINEILNKNKDNYIDDELMELKKTLKIGMGYFLQQVELNNIRENKVKAVNEQKYELASKYRDMEKTLISELPTLEEYKKIYDKL
jgi:hypothetical protein